MSQLRPLPKIVFLDRSTLSPQTVLKTLPFEHTLEVFESTSAEELTRRIADADVVITNKVKIPVTAIARSPHLKLIAIAPAGTGEDDHNGYRVFRMICHIGVTETRDRHRQGYRGAA